MRFVVDKVALGLVSPRVLHFFPLVLGTQLHLSASYSFFYWASVANAPNVPQPYWLIVLPLDVPDLTASLLL